MLRLGLLLSTAMLLLGCAASSDDAAATDASVDRTGELYDPDTVQSFELEIAEADWQAMLDALPERIFVPAEFRWNDLTVSDVGVRFKGNSSSSPHQTHKRSFLIKFGEYVKGQRFLGLRRLALDNGVQFGGLFSERLLTDILRELGVTTMRANHCRLSINGEYRGVYVNVERIDESFVERYFEDADGTLYKVDEGGPGADFVYLGDDVALYADTFEAKTNEESADLGLLVDFIRELDAVADADLPDFLSERWNMDQFVPLMAVMLMGGAFDQYTGWQPHNYYLYYEPSSERWTYVAWDLDVGFSDNAFGSVPVLAGWNAAYPYPKAPRPLLRRMLEDAPTLADYRQRAATILEEHFDPDLLIPRLRALHDQIAPHLVDDPFPTVRVTVPGDTDTESVVASIESFIRARHLAAVAELADPQATPPSEPGQIPPPGPPSDDAPSNLHVVAKSASHVELGWTDNASDEAAVIVQRCRGAGCAGFENHIGFGMPDVTSAVDTAVAAGETYRYRVYMIKPGPVGPEATGPSNEVQATAID